MTPTFVSAVRVQLSLAFMSAHPPILLGTVSMVDSIILMVMALVVLPAPPGRALAPPPEAPPGIAPGPGPTG